MTNLATPPSVSIGYTFWLTGLSGAGKTTLALGAYKQLKLYSPQLRLTYIDGDEYRAEIQDLDYSQAGRDRVGNAKVQRCLSENLRGYHVLVSGIACSLSWRRTVPLTLQNYKEVYVRCPLKICRERDIKGVYRETKQDCSRGMSREQIYEEGEPDLVIDTLRMSICAATDKLTNYIRQVVI
jgi:adenylylsulfate kinase